MSSTGEDRLPLIHFTSQDLPAEQNYAIWRQATDTLFDIALHDPGQAGRFQADLTSYSLGSVLLGHTRSVAQCFSRSTTRASALGHHMGSSPSTRTRSSSDHAVALRFMRKLILPFFPIGTGRTKFSTIFFNNDRFCGA